MFWDSYWLKWMLFCLDTHSNSFSLFYWIKIKAFFKSQNIREISLLIFESFIAFISFSNCETFSSMDDKCVQTFVSFSLWRTSRISSAAPNRAFVCTKSARSSGQVSANSGLLPLLSEWLTRNAFLADFLTCFGERHETQKYPSFGTSTSWVKFMQCACCQHRQHSHCTIRPDSSRASQTQLTSSSGSVSWISATVRASQKGCKSVNSNLTLNGDLRELCWASQ